MSQNTIANWSDNDFVQEDENPQWLNVDDEMAVERSSAWKKQLQTMASNVQKSLEWLRDAYSSVPTQFRDDDIKLREEIARIEEQFKSKLGRIGSEDPYEPFKFDPTERTPVGATAEDTTAYSRRAPRIIAEINDCLPFLDQMISEERDTNWGLTSRGLKWILRHTLVPLKRDLSYIHKYDDEFLTYRSKCLERGIEPPTTYEEREETDKPIRDESITRIMTDPESLKQILTIIDRHEADLRAMRMDPCEQFEIRLKPRNPDLMEFDASGYDLSTLCGLMPGDSPGRFSRSDIDKALEKATGGLDDHEPQEEETIAPSEPNSAPEVV